MKSQIALDREIKRVIDAINAIPCQLGPRGSVKYTTAFAVIEALEWARGRRVEYPSVALGKMEPLPEDNFFLEGKINPCLEIKKDMERP